MLICHHPHFTKSASQQQHATPTLDATHPHQTPLITNTSRHISHMPITLARTPAHAAHECTHRAFSQDAVVALILRWTGPPSSLAFKGWRDSSPCCFVSQRWALLLKQSQERVLPHPRLMRPEMPSEGKTRKRALRHGPSSTFCFQRFDATMRHRRRIRQTERLCRWHAQKCCTRSLSDAECINACSRPSSEYHDSFSDT